MKSPSIRRALLIRCGLGVGALLCLLSIGIYLTVRHGLYRELDQSIEQTAALLANQVELENEHIRYEWQEGMGTNKTPIDAGLFQFWDESSGTTTRSPGLQSRDLPKFCGPDGAAELRDIQLPNKNRHARAIGMRIYPFVLPEERQLMKERGRIVDTQTIPHILVVARDAKPVHRVLTRMRWILISGTILTLALGSILIDRVIKLSLRPIDQLTQEIRNRDDSQLDTSLDLPGALPRELTGLAENFASLLARMSNARRRERDFIRHAAHELRTPIAALQATTDLALAQPRTADAYATHLASCGKSAKDLGNLVNRLTTLSKIGQPNNPPLQAAIDLCIIVDDCLASFQSAFDDRGLTVSSEFPDTPLIASGDPTLVAIIFNNLFDNAHCYALPHSTIRIHGQKVDNRIVICVANATDEMPEDFSRLFEPLFRKDHAHSDSSTHLGIGLTLSLEAAHAMHADLTAHQSADDCVEFVLSMQSC